MVEIDRSSSPLSLPDQHMDDYEGQNEDHAEGDTDMSDAGQFASPQDPRRHPGFSPLRRH